MARHKGNASEALDDLVPHGSYEFAGPGPTGPMISVYPRGPGYLDGHNGAAANAEFQKIVDHPGLVTDNPIGLADLGLGRAPAWPGDTAKAPESYQKFMTLWKDADPDIPILKQAKAESVRLH